jgi:transposase InsO family protein
MDLQDAGCHARFLIRDRDGKYPALFDTILADTGIQVILSGVRVPRMNAVMERWIQTCRRELLDRTLIWDQRHLLHALHHYERHYNDHRPQRRINNARPLHSLPSPITDAGTITDLNIRRHDRLGDSSTSTNTPPDLRGRVSAPTGLSAPRADLPVRPDHRTGRLRRPLWYRRRHLSRET